MSDLHGSELANALDEARGLRAGEDKLAALRKGLGL